MKATPPNYELAPGVCHNVFGDVPRPRAMKKYWPLVALPTLLLLWWGFSRGESQVTLHFSAARRSKIVSTVSTNGKVEPAEWAAARAETSGVVRSVAVQRGQQVAAGQPLVVLDTASASAELAAALAKEGEARAETATLGRGGKAQTVANLNDSIASGQAALDVAQRHYQSLRRMAEKQAATRQQLEDAKDSVDRDQLLITALKNQKETLVTASDRSVAGAKLSDAEAAVALARHKLALARVRSPIAGTLYQFDLKIGAYLQPGDLAGYVGKLDRVKVTVYVDEPDLGRVALDMPVDITWDARPGRVWRGRVNKLPTEVIALGTRTVGEVTTVVENPNRELLPGVSVIVLIVSKVVQDAVSIPRSALRTQHGATGVFKLNGKSIAWTPINAGISDVNEVQVVSGLAAGDEVADRVVEPTDAEIRDGMRVKALFN
jgi:HlyD family secretion protein